MVNFVPGFESDNEFSVIDSMLQGGNHMRIENGAYYHKTSCHGHELVPKLQKVKKI